MQARLAEIRQVVTFSSLLIQLGGHFLDRGEFHQAIRLLQRVPTQAQVNELQNQRLDEAKADLQAAEAAKNPVRAAQMQASVNDMSRELEAFAKIEQFDSAARLRLAGAYFQLGRVREGCLILDQMVRQMEPDPVVESATASLMRGWMSLARYPRAGRTAELYQERFAALAEKPNLADVLFLQAQALEGQFHHRAAADAFRELAAKFPGKPIAAQAEFMAAYNILQLEDYTQAGALLDKQLKSLEPSDEMWPHAAFWRAMAFYFDQQWDEARKALESSLKQAKDGEYTDDARFRIAYSYFAEADYPQAIGLLEKFTTSFPQSEWLAEALLTLGDARAAEGELTAADKAYQAIPEAAAGFHDEGWMKRGNLRKAEKNLPAMKAVFMEFLDRRPQSPRVPEALQSIAWIARQQGDLPGARHIYWDAIRRFGDEPPRPGIEDAFLGIHPLYPGPGRAALVALLDAELKQATTAGKPRYAIRLGWSLARLHLTDKSARPELRARDSRMALAALAPHAEPKDTAPTILADLADALVETSDTRRAAELYEGLRKWWPRAPERDRAFAGLGFIAARDGRKDEALRCFDRFEKSSLMPRSPPDERGVSLVESGLGGKVALARASLLADPAPEAALAILSAVQKSKAMPADVRADALLATARLYLAQGRPREALPCFEQVYLLFNRFPERVATAYLERGAALEKLKLPDKAREVYSELANREDLSSFKAASAARERAIALGGVIPPSTSPGSLIAPASVGP